MKYVYLLILCTLVSLIIAFRNYKSDTYSGFSKKEAPLKFLYGFSMLLANIIPIKKQNLYASPKELGDKLKSISIGISAFTILILFGFLYTFTSNTTRSVSNAEKKVASSETSLIFNEVSSTTEETEFMTDAEYDRIKEAVSLFEKYRENIEKDFLGENESCLSITKPLNLITEYGEEKIAISWSFENPDVIDDSGNIIYDNISSDGCSTLAYAALTVNDTTATLSIPIYISPP